MISENDLKRDIDFVDKSDADCPKRFGKESRLDMRSYSPQADTRMPKTIQRPVIAYTQSMPKREFCFFVIGNRGRRAIS
jgi:hypothetical protein